MNVFLLYWFIGLFIYLVFNYYNLFIVKFGVMAYILFFVYFVYIYLNC